MRGIAISALLLTFLTRGVISFLLGNQLDVWLTTGDQSRKLSQQSPRVATQNSPQGHVVRVDKSKRYQTIEGFGAAFSNAAAYNIYHSQQRQQIIRDLFGDGNGIGISYVRLTMGASDFMGEQPYTYDDLQWQGDDLNLQHMSIDKDKTYVIPVLKEALSVNPNLKIVATPWSAPAWMKVSKTLNGGTIRTDSNVLEAYANFFVKFIQDYQREGITIDAITVQNEPLFSTNEYPSMSLSWQAERDFVKNHLGPKFRSSGIRTKILIFDHNWKDADYPKNILSDSGARQYIDGVAWHCYGGTHTVPEEVHKQYPSVGQYFTECSGGDWDTNFASGLVWGMRILFIGQTRAWAKTVLLWNLALDENHGPKVGVGGCNNCRGVITTRNSGSYDKNIEYYEIAHFSKFVKIGAVRLDTPYFGWDEVHSVAFQNPNGSVVVVVLNPSSQSKSFAVEIDGRRYQYHNLQPSSVVTFVTK